MPAYIVSMTTIQDAGTDSEYTTRAPPVVMTYGGGFLTRGEPVSTLECEPYERRMVLLEFPGAADAEARMANPSYREAAAFRHATPTIHRLWGQEGSTNAKDPDPKL
ncbi:MAG: DUF1330 domain-containing protein [Pseudomonadota bacterium]